MTSDSCLVMAHGAGSSSGFLIDAFPPERLGCAELRPIDDRTGRIAAVMNALAAATPRRRPSVLGGVSLGGHAAARLLARPDLPRCIGAGVIVMPAWTGPPGPVAGLTAAAAEALAVLGPDGVLAELDPSDWVTPQLERAWRLRAPRELVSELRTASEQAGPSESELRRISVPVAIVALRDDPLHPASVARAWAELIPSARVVVIERATPGEDLTAFADAAADALADLVGQPS